MIKLLKYGNTNTYYIGGEEGVLIDTDYAGTLPASDCQKSPLISKEIEGFLV